MTTPFTLHPSPTTLSPSSFLTSPSPRPPLSASPPFPLLIHIPIRRHGGGRDPVQVAEDPILKHRIQDHGEGGDK